MPGARPQIGVQTALVKFVEDHAAYARERRVLLRMRVRMPSVTTSDACLAADSRLEPRAKPDRPADGFPEQMRPIRAADRARRDAPRLEHQNLLSPEPGTPRE